MGPSHSALLTTEGLMYTWGIGSYGALGHNDNKNYTEPKLVEFFPKNNLRVT
jgi:alpha-tubulin suppressor-like RCC1 family protein